MNFDPYDKSDNEKARAIFDGLKREPRMTGLTAEERQFIDDLEAPMRDHREEPYVVGHDFYRLLGIIDRLSAQPSPSSPSPASEQREMCANCGHGYMEHNRNSTQCPPRETKWFPQAIATALSNPKAEPMTAREWLRETRHWDDSGRGYIRNCDNHLEFLSSTMEAYAAHCVEHATEGLRRDIDEIRSREGDEARDALRHQVMRNHDYFPSGCSACALAAAVLEGGK